MENTLLVGLSRQMVLERQMDVVANNVANVNTNGFKADNSLFQDSSIEALRTRGVQFLSCHTASEEQAKLLIHRWKLDVKREDIIKDLNAHTLPHVLVVPSMVASISVLQADGHYAYLTA